MNCEACGKALEMDNGYVISVMEYLHQPTQDSPAVGVASQCCSWFCASSVINSKAHRWTAARSATSTLSVGSH